MGVDSAGGCSSLSVVLLEIVLAQRKSEKYSSYPSCGWDFVLRRSTGIVREGGLVMASKVGEAEDRDPERLHETFRGKMRSEDDGLQNGEVRLERGKDPDLGKEVTMLQTYAPLFPQ